MKKKQPHPHPAVARAKRLNKPRQQRHRILKPHHMQNGWVFLRALRVPSVAANIMAGSIESIDEHEWQGGPVYSLLRASGLPILVEYNDHNPLARTITSRKVEEAVELYEWLDRCTEERLEVKKTWDGRWGVFKQDSPTSLRRYWPTLKEAYNRWHQEKH